MCTEYHAYIQGRNATVIWKSLLEAVIWRNIYNFIHWMKRDGKKVLKIHKSKQYVYKSNIPTRQRAQHINKERYNRY